MIQGFGLKKRVGYRTVCKNSATAPTWFREKVTVSGSTMRESVRPYQVLLCGRTEVPDRVPAAPNRAVDSTAVGANGSVPAFALSVQRGVAFRVRVHVSGIRVRGLS